MQARKQIHVVGAVIVRDSEILCARRGADSSLAGMWEFPGGKIEPGETPRAALEREIHEELACAIEVGDELMTTTHPYDFGDVTLATFWCALRSGTPTLTEHSEARWLSPADMGSLNWAPADLPAVQAIMSTHEARMTSHSALGSALPRYAELTNRRAVAEFGAEHASDATRLAELEIPIIGTNHRSTGDRA